MKSRFFIQLGINLLPTCLEETGEVMLFNIELKHKTVSLERIIIGNAATWKIKFYSEGVHLIKFESMLPSIKDQINDFLAWRNKFI